MNYHKKIAAPIDKDSSVSDAIDLGGWRRVAVELPAQASGALDASTATITITGCNTSTGTFVSVVTDGTASLSNGDACIVSLDTESWPRYIKINSDSTATAAAGFLSSVHVVD